MKRDNLRLAVRVAALVAVTLTFGADCERGQQPTSRPTEQFILPGTPCAPRGAHGISSQHKNFVCKGPIKGMDDKDRWSLP